MDKKAVASRIKAFMKQKGITQQALAEKMGVGQSEISEMIASKRRSNTSVIQYLCDNYGVSMDYLVKGEEHTNSDIIAKHDIPVGGLSREDRIKVADRIDALYKLHQERMEGAQEYMREAEESMREILTLYKMLVAGIS